MIHKLRTVAYKWTSIKHRLNGIRAAIIDSDNEGFLIRVYGESDLQSLKWCDVDQWDVIE